MSTANRGDDSASNVLIVAPGDGDAFWPVVSRWRAVVEVRDLLRSPEWMLQQVKPVPLSSKIERSLLEAVRTDDGRAVLEQASQPGEHRVAAAVIAALRLTQEHPDRALQFLSWCAQSPDDPSTLRFLRRYLPGLHVLVRLGPDLGVAVPISRDALGLLAADVLCADGDVERADQLLASLLPSAATAFARGTIRFQAGDYQGVHALAQGRPILDDLTIALRILDIRATLMEGQPAQALAEIEELMEGRHVCRPVERMARSVRAGGLRATGRDLEAGLIDESFAGAVSEPAPVVDEPALPQPPLFGRSLADALDDAWARIRRQPFPGPVSPLENRSLIDTRCDEAVALIRAEHYEAAETALLAAMDHADAWVDEGGKVVDDFYVLLAGLFNQLGLTTEEVATLERLRMAHGRAGSTLDGEISEHLVEARGTLDRLGS